MTCDHIHVALLSDLYILRIIGRIALPIYCLLLVEGFKYTKNHVDRFYRYILRLLILAAISVVPFYLAFTGQLYFSLKWSIFTTLALCLIMLYCCDYFGQKNPKLVYLVLLVFELLSYLVGGDYSLLAPLLVFIIYRYMNTKDTKTFIISFVLIVFTLSIVNILTTVGTLSLNNIITYYQTSYPLGEFALLSIPLIILYNGEKGYNSKFIKYFFYLYYPLHLLAIYFFKYCL